MDWILAAGGILLVIIGIIARIRDDLLWRLYSLEPRWRKDNPEMPENWQDKAAKQGIYLIAFGIFTIVLAFVLGGV